MLASGTSELSIWHVTSQLLQPPGRCRPRTLMRHLQERDCGHSRTPPAWPASAPSFNCGNRLVRLIPRCSRADLKSLLRLSSFATSYLLADSMGVMEERSTCERQSRTEEVTK
jgi:hypothetical protein